MQEEARSPNFQLRCLNDYTRKFMGELKIGEAGQLRIEPYSTGKNEMISNDILLHP